jgi:hypothetical protein
VQQSSESVAALAALAKAQAQLVNPEKSLTATILTGRAWETQRTFRYAPLSSGLEIVRKTLSEQEIAIIQTTAVDAASRYLNLTTMLAHASGQFALWAAACETALWPAGTFARAYAVNRRAAIESIIEADPLATCVRTIMGERTTWIGTASDLLRLCADSAREESCISPPWAKNPRALAGRLRRTQTFLRMLDIEIAFAREGRSGARMIRMSALGRSRSGAVGMDWEDGQNDGYRVNGEA